MDKMWAGRFQKALNEQADDFNSSISFDCRMYKQDITGSMAHAAMLGACGIITKDESEKIIDGLQAILDDITDGKLPIDMNAEDVHMFVEAELTKRLGDVGKKLHTGRSRNDQVAVDLRLWLRDESAEIRQLILSLIKAVNGKAKEYYDAVMPGYTHLQRAQPVTFGHYLSAYSMMLMRDVTRLDDAVKRMNICPLGSAALAGTTYPIDRYMTASKLGFDGISMNSLDGVSDRDYCIELLSCFATVMMHLSRFSEEIILWQSWEFKFIELDDSFTTGSSIMPQKKNPDMAELVRGKTGRVYGDLMAILTVLKGIPLAYNKDMQEDKESVFDAVDTVKHCLEVFAPMIETMKAIPENMMNAAKKGFINATDLADYLVGKGLPFRTAYKIVGQSVGYCVQNSKTLEQMTLDEYHNFAPEFDNDLYDAIDIKNCVEKRISAGGTGESAVKAELKFVDDFLARNK
jgi:argininosuccinate lyase